MAVNWKEQMLKGKVYPVEVVEALNKKFPMLDNPVVKVVRDVVSGAAVVYGSYKLAGWAKEEWKEHQAKKKA